LIEDVGSVDEARIWAKDRFFLKEREETSSNQKVEICGYLVEQ